MRGSLSGKQHQPRATPAVEEWQKVRTRTLVDQALDAIIEGASRGLILPGDRIIETEIAQKLGISRVPIREALRLLESQGLVVNEPYKGIRLVSMTSQHLDNILEARIALELAAARRALQLGRNTGEWSHPLKKRIDEMELMTIRNDSYGFAYADMEFHRQIFEIAGNDVLENIWMGLARQMIIIVGLSTLEKPMAAIVREHRLLLESFESGDEAKLVQALEEHISGQNHAVDFPALIMRQRAAREEAKSRLG